ncbi:alpha/beta fold hydrolase [Nocardia sp. NPDC020380]|uniref:alpha/beta fold hydrolase n=1 Tax=Nocardia sp. NPDC020380 TaxID=3364309 RepID=UPI00378CE408
MSKFTTWDGLELNYTEWPGEGVPVVLQHGIVADTNANWMSVGIVAALRGAGHRVISLDARGHGRSEKPHDPARYSWEGMARDVSALYDHLELDQVVQVGYSMGGVISLLVAGTDERVRRLVVGGIGCGVVDCGGIDWRAIKAEELVAAMQGETADTVMPGRMFRILADALGADRAAIAAVATGINAAPIESLSGIKVPALVLAGEADPFAAEPERLAEALPDGRCVTVPGDHLTATANPALHAALVEFLR